MIRNKPYRIYREGKLMVRRSDRRERAIGTGAPFALSDAINRRWPLAFVSDAFGDSRSLRILCEVDDFSRGCLARVVDTSIDDVRMAPELERVAMGCRLPRVIFSDNGSDLTGFRVLRWSVASNGTTSRPEKPV